MDPTNAMCAVLAATVLVTVLYSPALLDMAVLLIVVPPERVLQAGMHPVGFVPIAWLDHTVLAIIASLFAHQAVTAQVASVLL